jgi:chaperonin GroES
VSEQHDWEEVALATETAVNIRPLGDRVVIKPANKEEVSAGGLVLPDTAKEKPQKGTIVAVGPGRTLDNGSRQTPEVTEGQIVLYAKYAGTEVKIDGEEYLILSEKDVLAVV